MASTGAQGRADNRQRRSAERNRAGFNDRNREHGENREERKRKEEADAAAAAQQAPAAVAPATALLTEQPVTAPETVDRRKRKAATSSSIFAPTLLGS